MEKRDLMRGHLALQSKLEGASAELTRARKDLELLRNEREKERGQRLCQICITNETDLVLVPCGHQLCSACLPKLRQKVCPFDRRPIHQHIKLFNKE